MFNTPILYLIFNRPDLVEITFTAICSIKPKKLYIAADGPRIGNSIDALNCLIARQYVLSKIDWDCDIKTLFHDTNYGCGKAVSTAITWFFEEVEEGIILEDDCLPELSFFRFCDELLKKYKYEDKIMILSGFNPINNSKSFTASYTFSIYSGIWGWATWKRAWSKYNYFIPEWYNPQVRRQITSSFKYHKDAKALANGLDSVVNLECDTWDYQWGFYRTLHNSLGVIPRYNLISNIGFGLDATHTVKGDPKFENLPTKQIKFPLQHPPVVLSNELFNDEYNSYFEMKSINHKSPLLYRVINKIIKWF